MVVTQLMRSFPPVLTIFLISLSISFIITIVYKFTTNQKLMKMLQADMKSLRSEIKNTKDTSQAAQLNKHLMEKTMQQMMQSMKSTLITIVPIFFIFGWMSGNIAFAQVAPNEQFTASIEFEDAVNSEATIQSETLEILTNSTQSVEGNRVEWKLQGSEGIHEITYTYGDETYSREVILTDKWEYSDPYLEKKRSYFGIIDIGDDNPIKEESQISRIAVDLPSIHPLGGFRAFGWQPGWLATYFLFTLALTFPVRRLLKVH